MRKLFLARSLAAAFLALAASQSFAAEAGRPNIVVILADDFGVGDIQSHYPKNKIPTPCLDRLVGQGMSFTDAHSPSAVCTPTPLRAFDGPLLLANPAAGMGHRPPTNRR